MLKHADGCEINHDPEHGECDCGVFLRARVAALEAALRKARRWLPMPAPGLERLAVWTGLSDALAQIDAALSERPGGNCEKS